MGTNYYVYIPNESYTAGEELHIGKSSIGWVFSLRIYPERGIRTLHDWLAVLLNHHAMIRDEYGTNITAERMIRTIVMRDRPEPPVEWSEAEWAMNNAEPGPNNLLRGRAGDGRTPGEGTWDYCDYEFC